jgi:hypothetical protein
VEISPGQQPVMYQSKVADRLVLQRDNETLQDGRARDLLNSAEPLYHARAWEEFRATVTRAKALASGGPLRERLATETEFARLVMEAEHAETEMNWAAAAIQWQNAMPLFPAREWVAMRAAIGWLLADDVAKGVRTLALLSAQSSSELATRARSILANLTTTFATLEAEARQVTAGAVKRAAEEEFERLENEE